MKPPILVVEKLAKTFPPLNKETPAFTAVKGISFTLNQGEVVGLLGPNGAGKSTTISMLLGVTTPSSGSISYFGLPFETHRSEILQKVTFASTYIKMPWRLSVIENLQVYGLLFGVGGDVFAKRVEKMLKRFGVWEQRYKTMNELSAGQTTRVMLAKAFIPHPSVVLLDEPTASLDPDIAHQVRTFVKEQQAEYNTTILYTSHNMDEVADVCDRVMVLKGGEIIASDTPEKLASSISLVKVVLQIKDGLKRTKKLADTWQLTSIITNREIEIMLDEHKIADFLHYLAQEGITYTGISVAKPNLEDYFLNISRDEVTSETTAGQESNL